MPCTTPVPRGTRVLHRCLPTTRRVVVAFSTMLLALAAPGVGGAASSAGAPSPGRSAPLLDPRAPHGAWAGYSLGHSSTARTASTGPSGDGVAGMDVSGHQGTVNWQQAWADGARFTYVKATEGTTYHSPVFNQQYTGSYRVGMIRGAYHFALPNVSDGAAQAHFFVDNGGGWSADGRTLPGALDIEYNPYGPMCYGMSPDELSQWITEFSTTYQARTGRYPAIYTTRHWWNTCTGGNESFAATHPLWVARYGPEVGALPAGWNYHTIWQFNDHGTFPGDQNTFNGDRRQLVRFAG
ncbi:lysozyme [Halopolyspora algeriensis]|uniref:lysozyme n=1 Tax=Halopolyspora algeriensis TaxID=1500506 RepID=UPI003B83A0C3